MTDHATAIEAPATEGQFLAKVMASFSVAGGVLAAFCGGYANFRSFSAMAETDIGFYLWGAAGIAASLISFSAFTLVWWNHNHQRRLADSRRALAVGIIASLTGIMGTWMFIASASDGHSATADQTLENRARLEGQIDRWTSELEAIPEGIGTVASIERYMAEVERVGRTDERPYRTAIENLGHAERRALLEDQIARAETRLLSDPTLTFDPPNRLIDPWLLALLIEFFASQGTAVGTATFLTMIEKKKALSWLQSLDDELS